MTLRASSNITLSVGGPQISEDGVLIAGSEATTFDFDHPLVVDYTSNTVTISFAYDRGTGILEFPTADMLGSAAFADMNTLRPNRFVEVKSAAYQITEADQGKVFVVSGTTTLTLPDATAMFNLGRGFNVTVKAQTGSTTTVARKGSDTIDTVAGNLSVSANTAKTLCLSSATNWETL